MGGSEIELSHVLYYYKIKLVIDRACSAHDNSNKSTQSLRNGLLGRLTIVVEEGRFSLSKCERSMYVQGRSCSLWIITFCYIQIGGIIF